MLRREVQALRPNAPNRSWYWETVEPLRHGVARESVWLHSFSRASGAFNHKAQLVVILDWLEWPGLIRREGEMVHAGQVLPAPPANAVLRVSVSEKEAEPRGSSCARGAVQ